MATQSVQATPFTTTVPGTGITLPTDYPQAGGVAFVLIGTNGNVYYQFSDPTGAFIGYQFSGSPAPFRGNPFTINRPLTLDCGASSCATYFGGSIAAMHIRFTAYDGDTEPGGFDENDISLIINGFNVGSWSGLTTEATNTAGTQSFGLGIGFGNNTFDTGWFRSTNSALLANILSTGQTTTQVYDRDPNDNYWDFRQGNTLPNQQIVTVAPGLSIDKEARSGPLLTSPVKTTFSAVGETIYYTYVLANIGSVRIQNLAVSDDKIANVSCTPTTLDRVNFGQTPNTSLCTATYLVTQADVDAGQVVNNATATGVPEFGVLGAVTDRVTVIGPAAAPAITVVKNSTLTAFGAAGSTVPYTFTVRNTGNVTLTNVSVTDPKVSGISCPATTLAPSASTVCTGSYTVRQSDVDAYAGSGTLLSNTATVTATAARGTNPSATSTKTLPGSVSTPALTVTKTALQTSYTAVGNQIQYQIRITNTGNVTFPAAPAVSDPLTGGATCPAGTVLPGASITCTAIYTVRQSDIDAGQVNNTATASITIAGRTASGTASASVPAVVTPGLTMIKRLASGTPSSFSAAGTSLIYEYELRNTGNVTLNTPTVTDDKVTVTCPASPIAPGTTLICTSATYSTLQTDVDSGGVTNIATGRAISAATGNPVSSAQQSLTVPSVRTPRLTIAKTAPTLTAAQFVAGRVVTYSYQVTNSGNVTITNQISVTDNKISGAFACGAPPYAPASSVTCTAQYTLTQSDVNTGTVVNTATASDGTTVSAPATANISPTFMPAISLVKSANPVTVSALNQPVTYSFTVTNSGNTTIDRSTQPITITDAKVPVVTCPAGPATLSPSDTLTCTGTYLVTQADLDAGRIDNTATASFPFTNGGSTITVTSPSATETVIATENASFTFDKRGPAQFTSVNELLTYTFEATNTGNVTLTRVSVTDPLIPTLSCTLTAIAPGASASCTGTYRVTQADIDAEVINNTATAIGSTQSGGGVTQTDTETTPINPSTPSKTLDLSKVPTATSYSTIGDSITYFFEVQNTGTQTITNISVSDPSLGYSCTILSLAPGATSSICSVTRTVTQADLDVGSIVNTATASAPGVPSDTDSVTATGPVRAPALNFTKSSSGPYSAAGDNVTFTLRVENTGNVTLSNVAIADSFFSPTLTCSIGTLLPGAVDTSCQGTYSVTQVDVDAGSIANSATATADVPAGAGASLVENASVTVAGPTENAAVEVVKTPSISSYAAVGDLITYDFEVFNRGNVTLTGLSLSDLDLGYNCSVLADLAPGASTTSCLTPAGTMQAVKTVAQADLDAGVYTNTVSVSGVSAGVGTAVTDDDTVNVLGPNQVPQLTMTKATNFVGTYSSVGQVIGYDYVVRNTGNITLTSAISVSDDKNAVTCDPTPTIGIPPNGTINCSGSYTVTQADLDAGLITNTATASITQPVIPVNPGDPSSVLVTSPPVSETVNAAQTSTLSIDKRIAASSLSTYSAVGDQVTFEYVVSNTGNTTLNGPITVSDDKIAGTLTCQAGDLAPGASVTCSQIWTATQADLDAKTVTNIATASADFGGTVTSAPDQETISAVLTPRLDLVKVLDPPLPTIFQVSEALNYRYTVTNTGNVTISPKAPATSIEITDNLAGTISCGTGSLAPTAQAVCTTIYTITVNDILLGSATNTAFATGSFDGSDVVSPTRSRIFPVSAMPALTIAKTADKSNLTTTDLGTDITYTYTVENTGNTAFADDVLVNDDQIGEFLCQAFNLGTVPPTFAVGATLSCMATYTVTQPDLDAGGVTNSAVAKSDFAGTPVESPADVVTVPATIAPALVLAKSSTGPISPVVGDTITYTLEVTNSGQQTIANVQVTDPLFPGLSCTAASLAPTQQLTCAPAPTYVVTQADVDAQTLVNTATARGAAPDGSTVTSSDTDSVTLVAPVPAVTVTKAVTPPSGTNPDYSSVGEVVVFQITVQNTGNVTLSSTDVTDNLAAGTCSIGSLAPGATDTSCLFSYTTTQADIDAGSFTNIATATSQPVTQPGTISDSGQVVAIGPAREPRFSLVKTADVPSFSSVGDVITYSYTVANTGNVSLTAAPVLTDDKLGTVSCPAIPGGFLLPGDFITCTAPYSVTQGDVDSGQVVNIATVTSADIPVTNPVVSATVTVPSVRTPGISLTKVASPSSGVAAGDTISYTYTVQNTGNVTLTNVTMDDQHTSAAGTGPLAVAGDVLITDAGVTGDSTDAGPNGIWDILGPGDVVEFVASYPVTQADIDAGNDISNVATVTSNSPAGTTPPTAGQTVDVPVQSAVPGLEVIKTVTGSTGSAAGDTVSFQITVANTGNVTLDGVVLTDTLTRTDGTSIALTSGPTLTSGDGGVLGDLDVAETWIYQASRVLTQSDIDAGGLSNSARVTATAPSGSTVADISDDGIPGGGSDPTIFPISAINGIEAEKTVSAPSLAVGGVVTFTIDITNTGNVTLSGTGISNDILQRVGGASISLTSGPSFVSADQGSGAGILLPGETASYRATYVLTQADIDAGGIANQAEAIGTPPVGGAITDISDDGDDADGNTTDDVTEVLIPSTPSLALVKRLQVGSGPTFGTAGDTLTYEFEVTNSGNVTITNPVTINDPLISGAGGSVSCAAPPIAPGSSILCTGSYVVTQADIDAGDVTNTATATDGATTSAPAQLVTPANQTPSLVLVKDAGSVPAASFVTGAVVPYTYTATNNGNTTITTPITISDNLIAPANITCDPFPPAGIAPGGSYVCRGSYTVTAGDVFVGVVTNLATASDGTTTSPQVSETVPDAGVPALSIVKTSTSSTFAAVGDVIPYSFRVTNTGTQAFAAAVDVFDDRIGTLNCFTPSGADPDFVPSEFVDCTASYTVTQVDLDAGGVTNQAYAQSTVGGGATIVSSAPVSLTIPASASNLLTLTKSVATLPVTAAGQVLTYTLTATNDGNQTLANVLVTDPLLPGLSCSVATLAPTGALTCSDTYTVTQSDLDAGTLVNSAAASSINPAGAAVNGTASLTTAMPAAAPSLVLTKSASPSPFGAVGSTVTYGFAVENTGNVTLSNVEVTDSLDGTFLCTVASIAPGATDTSCSLPITVTQAMVDAGSQSNTANVTAEDPSAAPVTGTDTIVTPGPVQLASLEATKVAAVGSTSVGSTVTYSLAVENTGNVTLDMTSVADTMTRRNGDPTTLDAPFAYASGDTNTDGRLGVGETWIYTAQKTIRQSDINATGFDNTVTVRATDPGGNPVSDVSDDGDDGDGNTTDDPTEVPIAPLPSLNARKTIDSVTGTSPGDTVTFRIRVVNTGNVDLLNISLADSLTRADATPLVPTTGPTRVSVPPNDNGDTTLGVTETLEWLVTYVLTQDDVDAGGIENTVTASATPITGGAAVSDVSDDGDSSDGNVTDDPTVLRIAPMPGLDVVKVLNSAGTRAGDTVNFTISAENAGNVTLTGLGITDSLQRLGGGVLTPDSVTYIGPGVVSDPLAVGATATWSVVYTLVQADVDAGGVQNSATISATTPLGAGISDTSDDGDDADGNTTDDATVAAIAAAPSFDVTKSAGAISVLFPTIYQVNFTLDVTNTGNVTQTGIRVADDLAAFLGSATLLNATYPPVIGLSGFTGTPAADGSYDGLVATNLLSGSPELAPGATGQVTLTITYQDLGGQLGGTNTAAATSDQLALSATASSTSALTDGDGDGVPDALEGCGPGDDRDGDGICDRNDYDPTGYFYCEDTGAILPGGAISVSGPLGTQTGIGSSANITIVQDGSTGQFQFFVTAAGSYTLNLTYPSTGAPSTARSSLGTLDATTLLPSNPAILGSSEFGTTGRLADFSAGANRFYTVFDIEAGDPIILSNNIPLRNCRSTEAIFATKTADRESVVFGETVNFTLTFTNNTSRAVSGARLIDTLPAGMLYTPGSATIDGVAREPKSRGLRLSWGGVTIAPAQTVTVTLAARVAANGSYGELSNRGWLEDANGNILSNIATATVRVEPEHVFDCSDVIGKVFDDLNQNGYQDPGEPGLPGVRLATVRGELITTDKHGRYHVPCAELPSGIGTNFSLKLDTRTLPSGYRVTTENPRVVRLTAGKFAKLNFGASLSNVIDIDLTAAAFKTGTTDPKPALEQAVEQLVAQIRSKPSVIRISYILHSERRETAETRLDAVEMLLREKWQGAGRYKLSIERTIKRVQ